MNFENLNYNDLLNITGGKNQNLLNIIKDSFVLEPLLPPFFPERNPFVDMNKFFSKKK